MRAPPHALDRGRHVIPLIARDVARVAVVSLAVEGHAHPRRVVEVRDLIDSPAAREGVRARSTSEQVKPVPSVEKACARAVG